ncbi:lanthionine synthetase LanC family protein [Spirosoma sordidisoli]|uniref:Uncharacterized protein n=1 Tax=Spirosoma sordidisoli TaxID=2502893 RepID=A0A4Q2UGF3_9BACT|nr:hypothetical protein [Spirosoma sordidisoli]RYC68443.1 hypothetical protein EQG79_18975 [Spirosoma sordidisoli]
MPANWTASYARTTPQTTPIESALFQVWQGNETRWPMLRRQVVEEDLGQHPDARLALLLGEETLRHQPPGPERAAFDRYLCRVGCEAIEAGSFSVADGIAPLVRHFLARPATDLAHAYADVLLDLLLPRLQQELRTPQVKLSLADGLTGALASLGAILDRIDGERIGIYGSGIRALIEQYVRSLQGWQLPVDADQDQHTMFPRVISRPDMIWETATQNGWAYGDVGQALFLARASRWLHQPALATWATRIAMYTVFRRMAGNLTVSESGIRNGQAGLLLLYWQLYQLTDEPELKREADYWQQQLTVSIPALEAAPQPDHSLLDGLLGIYGALRAVDEGDLPLQSLLFDLEGPYA